MAPSSIKVYSIWSRVSMSKVELPSPSFFCRPHPGGDFGEASSARPFRGSGTRVTAFTGVSALDAFISHSY